MSQDFRRSYSTACTWDKRVREGTKWTVSSRSQSSYLTRQAAQVTSESTSADMLRDQIEKGPAPKAGFAECLGFRQALKGRAAQDKGERSRGPFKAEQAAQESLLQLLHLQMTFKNNENYWENYKM